jgi:hypothetical protein
MQLKPFQATTFTHQGNDSTPRNSGKRFVSSMDADVVGKALKIGTGLRNFFQ